MEWKLRILLVDDKLERRRAIGKILTDQGYKVVFTQDGLSALNRLRLCRIALVLTDTKLPVISGPELVNEIHCRFKNMPVIGMSSREACRDQYKYFWRKGEPARKLLSLVKKLTSS